ncbi:hydrolase [Longimicrobium sp.]|uniref:hydrolase n=1 Tax=Longimicrobium sp. TaxID=2029185 RepID=UPI002BF90E36|nr:hydrolase [Longimicrobium sp.]HSU15394.1 hydrolase [Longimicrobium sp.]
MPEPLTLDAATTALVLIDLQQGIVARDTMPHAAANVVANAVRLADAFRAAGALVVLVRVSYSDDGRDMLRPPVDNPPPPMPRPPGWDRVVPEVGPRDGDIVVTKRNWGAFHGTDLELQLRRRGIRTIVLGGIATNFGVESTARGAFERAYAQVIVEDATSALSAGAHEFALTTIFPRFARIRSTDEVLAALR